MLKYLGEMGHQVNKLSQVAQEKVLYYAYNIFISLK